MDKREAVGKFTGSEEYEILITVKNITVIIRMFVLQVIKLLIQISYGIKNKFLVRKNSTGDKQKWIWI